MPLKITNELLDELQQMPDTQVEEVYGLLDDKEKNELFTATDNRNKGMLVGTAPDAPAPLPNRSVGQPALGEVVEQGEEVTFDLPGKTQSLAMRPNPYLKGAGATHNANVLAGADMSMAPGKRELSNAAVEVAQDEVGLPIAKSIVDIAPEVSSPAAKVLGRDFLTRTAGPAIQDYGIAPEVKARGETSLKNFGKIPLTDTSVGDIGRSVVTEAGNPINAIPLGWEASAEGIVGRLLQGKALQAAKPLARMVGAGLENAALDVGAGVLTNADDLRDRAVGAFIGGAGLRGALDVGGKSLKSIKWGDSKVVGSVKPGIESGQPYVNVVMKDGQAVKVPVSAEELMALGKNWSMSAEVLGDIDWATWGKYQNLLDTEALASGKTAPRFEVSGNKTKVERQGSSEPIGALAITKADGSLELEPIKAPKENPDLGAVDVGSKVGVPTEAGPVIGQVTKSNPDGRITITTPDGRRIVTDKFQAWSANLDEVLNAAVPAGTSPDEAILKVLRNNPRMSITELAGHAGMDIPATRELLGKLEDRGFVQHDSGDWDIGPNAPKALPPLSGKALEPPATAPLQNVIPEQAKLSPTPPGELPGNTLKDYQTVHNVLQQFNKRENALVSFFKGLENQRHRGAVEFQRFVKEFQAAEQHSKVKAHVVDAIQEAVPKGTKGEFFNDVHALALGKIKDVDMSQKYPDIWNEAKSVVLETIQEARSNDQLIEALGGIPEDLITARAEGATDQYVARKFRAYLDPDGWAKNVPSVVEKNAIDFIAKENPSLKPGEIAFELSKLLNTDDPLKAFVSSPVGKKYAKALKGRKDIPEPIRAFMGEIDNGALSLAETLGNQRAIIQNLKTWLDVVKDGKYWSQTFQVDEVGKPFIQLPDDKKRFGVAAGGFVNRDLFEALTPVQQNQSALAKFLRDMTGFVKGNEVSTLKAIYNSTLGNLTSTGFMGKAGLNFSSGGSDLSQAWKALKAYRTKPSSKEAALIKEAITYGAHWGGQLENELGFKRAFDAMDEVYGKDTSKDVWSKLEILKKVALAPYKGIRKYQEIFGSILDANDAVIRMGNYISARRYYQSQGMDLATAARAASKDINDVFWNAQNVGKVVEQARSSGAGIVARYLTALTEEMRIWKNAGIRLQSRPDTRFRVLGWGATVAGAYAIANAKSGDDDLGDPDTMTKRQKAFSPLMLKLPITENGKRLFYDMSNHFPLGRFLQGHPDDAAWRRIAANMLIQPTSGGAAEGPVQDFLNSTGLVRAFGPGRGPIEGDNGLSKAMEHLHKLGAAPKLPLNLYKEYDKTQQHGIYPPMQGPVTAAARSVLPIVSAPADQGSRAAEFSGEIMKLKGDLQIATKTGRNHLVPGIIERIKYLSEQMGAQP
jgi:hypothetical protein